MCTSSSIWICPVVVITHFIWRDDTISTVRQQTVTQARCAEVVTVHRATSITLLARLNDAVSAHMILGRHLDNVTIHATRRARDSIAGDTKITLFPLAPLYDVITTVLCTARVLEETAITTTVATTNIPIVALFVYIYYSISTTCNRFILTRRSTVLIRSIITLFEPFYNSITAILNRSIGWDIWWPEGNE